MTRSVRFPRRGAAAIASGSVVVLALALSACSSSPSQPAASPERVTGGRRPLRRCIRHPQDQAHHRHRTGEPLLRQLLRTYPGADGIPCRTDNLPCAYPFRPVDARRPTTTRPTSMAVARTASTMRSSTSTGKDGRVHHRATSGKKGCGANVNTVDNPECSNSATPDVMGYHTSAEIPNYWTYAKDFTLDDHMFEPVASWSLPDTSTWSQAGQPSARAGPSSCKNEIRAPTRRPDAEVRGPGH